MTKPTTDRLMELLHSDLTGDFGVFTNDGISVKYLPTLELAKELADEMIRYHRRNGWVAKRRTVYPTYQPERTEQEA